MDTKVIATHKCTSVPGQSALKTRGLWNTMWKIMYSKTAKQRQCYKSFLRAVSLAVSCINRIGKNEKSFQNPVGPHMALIQFVPFAELFRWNKHHHIRSTILFCFLIAAISYHYMTNFLPVHTTNLRHNRIFKAHVAFCLFLWWCQNNSSIIEVIFLANL